MPSTRFLVWGANGDGQLCTGDQEDKHLPAIITLTMSVLVISGGARHILIIENSPERTLYLYGFSSLRCFLMNRVEQCSAGWNWSMIKLINGTCYFIDHGNGHSINSIELPVIDNVSVKKVVACIKTGWILFDQGHLYKATLVLTSSTSLKLFFVASNVKNIYACADLFALIQFMDETWSIHGSFKLAAPMPPPSSISTIIAVGWHHIVALLIDKKTVFCWTSGGCSVSSSAPTFRQFELPGQCLELRCGTEHTVALLEDGSVITWGWNEHGNCSSLRSHVINEPVKVQTSFRIKHVYLTWCGCLAELDE